MTTRAGWISRLTVSLTLTLTAFGAAAQETIKIGEINSYKAQPAFLGPYKNGWNLALDEVNASGGVLGKKLEVVSRDDNANPGDTVRAAQELVTREQAKLLFGGYLSNTGLALADYAKQRRIFFLAAEPLTDKIVWQDGNKYTYRLRPSTYMQVAMLVPEAAKLHKNHTVARKLEARRRMEKAYDFFWAAAASRIFKYFAGSFLNFETHILQQKRTRRSGLPSSL